MESELNDSNDKDTGRYGPPLAFPGSNGEFGRLVTRKDAMVYLNVSARTMMRYEESGQLHPIKNRINGRIHYTDAEVMSVLGSKVKQAKTVVLYCRSAVLGSRSNKGASAEARLARQVERMSNYCSNAGIRVDEIIQDIGPGDGSKSLKGLNRLIEKVLRKEVSTIVVETQDRLARWGMGRILLDFFEWHGIELHVASPVLSLSEYREEAKQDLELVLMDAREQLAQVVDSQ